MVFVKQLYTGCLAQAAYFIESDGETAVVDPLRSPTTYITLAQERSKELKKLVVIKYILETHLHADFVGGHEELARITGAKIVFGPSAETEYQHHKAEHGEVLQLGRCTITVLHTPGHTMESTTYLLKDEDGKPHCIFTGDTLFIGDVGRPDLAQKTSKVTPEECAALLYRSLRTVIMPLPPDVIVYPGHGAGSACGKNMSSETFDTLGNQIKVNPALRENMTMPEFVEYACSNQPPAPGYFSEAVKMNKGIGITSLTDLLKKGNVKYKPLEFKQAQERLSKPDEPCFVVDTRDANDVAAGSLPGAVFCGIDGPFAPMLASVFPQVITNSILFVPKSEDRINETVTRMARVGCNGVSGCLDGGIEAWSQAGLPVVQHQRISSEEFAQMLNTDADITILDVRKPGEYEDGHIRGARLLPLSSFVFQNFMKESRDPNVPIVVYCAGGYRSFIFMTALKEQYNFQGQIMDVIGGFSGMKNSELLRDFIEE